MKSESKALSPLRRFGKYLLSFCGVLVILAALALGVFRLMIAQIPEYQTELKAWVAEELGIVVEFAALDARLGLTGPELSLRDTRLGDGADDGFLEAAAATITLDPLALVLERRVEISRLTLAGVVLTIERDANGEFRLGEHAIKPGSSAFADSVPESVEVVIRDSALHYVDAIAGRRWDFDDFEIVIVSEDGILDARASLRPPAGLARRIELTGEAAEDGSELAVWQIEATTEALDLAQLAELVPFALPDPVTGTGDLTAAFEWRGVALEAVRFEAALEAVAVGTGDAAGAAFERLAATGRWQRTGPAGWRLALDALEVERDGRDWGTDVAAEFLLERDPDGIRLVRFTGDFFRLDDLKPFVLAYPDTQLAEQWRLYEPSGAIRDLDFALERQHDEYSYSLGAAFDALAVRRAGTMPGVTGVSGRVDASADSGTIVFSSGPINLDWPQLFRRPVDVEALTGSVFWRQRRDDVQVLGVGLGLGLLGREATANFELQLPHDGSSPFLDLDARLDAVDLVPAKLFLPTPVMPVAVVDWLEQAIVGGRGRDIELDFIGPLEAFPFDDGGGEFRVAANIAGATLDYMRDWPLAAELDGRIEFVNAGFAATGSGRTLSNRAEAVRVEIADLREPVLELKARTNGPLAGVLDYLRGAPLIAAHLGPDIERLAATGGDGGIDAALALPLMNLGDFTLDADITIADGTLEIAGLRPAFSEIEGVIHADQTAVSATGIESVFLGGSVTTSLRSSERPGYRAELSFAGETSAEAVAESFALPHEELLAGQTLWRGQLLLPALDPLATTRTRLVIDSNLAGVALRFPEPLAKPPSEPSNLHLDFEFAADDRLELSGNLGATRRFLLSFATGDGGLDFTRGTVRFGGDEPIAPNQEGILVNGRLETLALDRWIELAGSTDLGRAGPSFLGADVEIADFHVFGQRLGSTALRVERRAADWAIDVDSEAIAGSIVVPRAPGSRAAIVADMRRLYLAPAEGGDLAGLDPRELPGLEFTAAEFGIGTRRFGRVSGSVVPTARGLELREFSSATPSYSVKLSGTWQQGALGSRTSISAELESSNVHAALTELGLDPVITGEAATVSADIHWDGAPGGDWLDHLNGEVSLFVETGTLREVDPGAGRMLGLMSIAALPRRLALDFRDVVEDGLAFDEIEGDFRIIDGNAYTNNLKLGGPAAEIGVVGRTGLRDRDYTQQFVVSPEPGKMLPTVATVLGGPGAGAATFVFTRLFKNRLKGIGQVSYCLRGPWDEPTVEQIGNDEPALAELCAELPASMREPVLDE